MYEQFFPRVTTDTPNLWHAGAQGVFVFIDLWTIYFRAFSCHFN